MMSASYAGKYKEAKAYVESKGEKVGFDPDSLSGVITAGQIPLAIEILQSAKKENPALASQIDDYIKQLLAGKK
jgi:hypothetical protein